MIYDYEHLNAAIPNQGPGNFGGRPTFTQKYESAEDFVSAYTNSPLYEANNKISNPTLLYYLLAARYGNSVISSWDPVRFEYDLFTTIFIYGPTWEAKLKIQENLRGLLDDENELLSGSTQINNHSYNPSSPPRDDAFAPLATINDQTANKRKKSKIEAYSTLLTMLKSNATEEFLDHFGKLFVSMPLQPTSQQWYVITKEEQEILDI